MLTDEEIANYRRVGARWSVACNRDRIIGLRLQWLNWDCWRLAVCFGVGQVDVTFQTFAAYRRNRLALSCWRNV